MGKIRRERKKIHISAAKPVEESEDVSMSIPKLADEVELRDINFKNILTTDSSPVGISNITKEPIKPTPTPDQDTTVTTPKTKKEKRQLRHERFMKKLQVGFESKTQTQAKKKREKTVIVGDMQPLVAALPDFDALFNEDNQKRKTKSKKSEKKLAKKPPKRLKSKMRNNLKDIDLFKQVLQHPKFQENPSDAMNDHVKYLIEKQDE